MAENTYKKWYKDRKRAQAPIDEYDRFIQSEIVCDIKDPRHWWLEEPQHKVYPNLSKMALDMLSISAMSAEPECLFSGAKISITDRRNHLSIESIEALECLKSWMGIPEFSDVYSASSSAVNLDHWLVFVPANPYSAVQLTDGAFEVLQTSWPWVQKTEKFILTHMPRLFGFNIVGAFLPVYWPFACYRSILVA